MKWREGKLAGERCRSERGPVVGLHPRQANRCPSEAIDESPPRGLHLVEFAGEGGQQLGRRRGGLDRGERATDGRQSGRSNQPGGSSGNSSRITGPSVRVSSPSAAPNTWCWNSTSFGSPSGRPSWNGTMRARGGRVASTCWRTSAMTVEAIPADSTWWASALTARVQIGQTGVNSTAST